MTYLTPQTGGTYSGLCAALKEARFGDWAKQYTGNANQASQVSGDQQPRQEQSDEGLRLPASQQ